MGELLGYGATEMIGQPLFAFMDPQWEERAKANLERGRIDGQSGGWAEYDFEFRHKSGSPVVGMAARVASKSAKVAVGVTRAPRENCFANADFGHG